MSSCACSTSSQTPWIKRVTKEEAKRSKSHHTVKMLLQKQLHKRVINWITRNMARYFKKQSLRNTLLITVSGDREKAVIWGLDKSKVGGQTIRPQAIPARMSCDDVREWVKEEVLKEYKNPQHNRGLQGHGDRGVCYVCDGRRRETPREAKVSTMHWTVASVGSNLCLCDVQKDFIIFLFTKDKSSAQSCASPTLPTKFDTKQHPNCPQQYQ